MKLLRSLLGIDYNYRNEIISLRNRLEENEKKVEKLLDMVNILAAFDEKLASDMRTVASHVALMELSIMNKQKQNMVSLKRKSNDDDTIN